MKTSVTWVKDRLFLGESASGHTTIMEARGGDDPSVAPSPMEMLILGMGGCTAFDVVHILERMRQPVSGCRVEIDSERASEDPKVYTKIHVTFYVSGDGLDLAKAERAAALSAEKYCSASIMLGQTAEITHSVVVE